jgi:hypothetical protein
MSARQPSALSSISWAARSLCSEAEAEAEIALGRVGATLVGIGEPGYPHALAEIECLSLKGDAPVGEAPNCIR